MFSKSASLVVFAACCALSLPAAAHVDVYASGSFFTGVVHSFSGIDHLLAMFAVGMGGALALRRAPVWLPRLAGVAVALFGSATPLQVV